MKNFVFILLGLLTISLLFLGCKNDSIQFRRDSQVSEMMKNVKSDKPTVRKSSGVVIYRDNEQHTNSPSQNKSFGPGEPNFDIKVKL